MSFWETVKHFKPEEFASGDEIGSGKRISHLLVRMLDDLREKMGEPIHITSGVRTEARNEELVSAGKGAVKDSAHLKGLAVDILCPDSSYRFVLVSKALESGFLRIGVGSRIVHLDLDPAKPQAVIWLYGKT